MKYRGLTISITPDCDENTGGYYCQVCTDEDMENQIDDFCIHQTELAENPDVEHWVKVNVDSQYHYYEEVLNEVL